MWGELSMLQMVFSSIYTHVTFMKIQKLPGQETFGRLLKTSFV